MTKSKVVVIKSKEDVEYTHDLRLFTREVFNGIRDLRVASNKRDNAAYFAYTDDSGQIKMYSLNLNGLSRLGYLSQLSYFENLIDEEGDLDDAS